MCFGILQNLLHKKSLYTYIVQKLSFHVLTPK